MTDGVVFTHKFWPFYSAILGCTVPVAIAGAALDFGIAQHPWKTAVLILFTLALAAALCFAFTRMKITVYREGLHCYDISGSYKFAKWEEMKWARPTRMMIGLPILRIGFDNNQSSFWLPMYLADMARFNALVSSYAGLAHPVAIELAKRGSKS